MKFTCLEENKICAYCEKATLITGSDACICEIKGIVNGDGVCKKFSFDLLKLNPKSVKLPENDEIVTF